MIKILLILFLIPSIAFGSAATIGGVAVEDIDEIGGVAAEDIASFGGVTVGYNFLTDANCVGAWYMNADGSTGETDRCSGGSENLTASGSMGTSATVPTGYSGASRDFEFTDDDYLGHADGGATDVGGAEQGLTFCAWFDVEDTATDGYLISKWGTDAGQSQYLLKFESTGTVMEVRISDDGGSGTGGITGSDSVASGWHHACGVHDPVNNLVLLYVDGVEDTSSAWTDGVGVTNTGAAFRIGTSENATSRPWDGLVDEVIVLDRALTAAEILGMFTFGIDGANGRND